MNLSYFYANFNFKKNCFRIASTSFASLSSNLRQAQVQLGRSSFYYEADTSQDSIYEDPTQKRQGTNFVLFTFFNDINRLGAQSSYVVKYFEGSNAVKTTSMRN